MYKRIIPIIIAVLMFSCSDDESPTEPMEEALNPDTAPEVMVDRFSEEAGNLMVRTEENGLPGPNEAINYDMAPFITKGLGPNGEMVEYYNFDVQPTSPAPIFVLFKEGSDTPVEGQLNIINVVPGDNGYNDFWHVHKVTVPSDYKANTVTSVTEINDKGFEISETTTLVNCPVVPDGSTAMKRGGENEDTGLTRGWYKDSVVYYFNFSEKALEITENGMVPLSDIYVTFNVNPPDGGPATGFMTEQGTDQTHNVTETIPSDDNYSPLWLVNVYDNTDFGNVSNLQSAMNANILANGVANVNCPIVKIGN